MNSRFDIDTAKPDHVDLRSYAMAKLGLKDYPSNYHIYKALKARGYDVTYSNIVEDINKIYAILKFL